MNPLPKVPWLREIITVATLAATGLWMFATLQNKVETNEQKVINLQVTQAAATLINQDQSLQLQELKTALKYISENLQEIKSDLKDLKRISK
jgi:hypothetical protein